MAMNARESENYLPISRSSTASNSVDIFWAEIYRVRLLLGPNLVHEYQITANPYGVDMLSPPP